MSSVKPYGSEGHGIASFHIFKAITTSAFFLSLENAKQNSLTLYEKLEVSVTVICRGLVWFCIYMRRHLLIHQFVSLH